MVERVHSHEGEQIHGGKADYEIEGRTQGILCPHTHCRPDEQKPEPEPRKQQREQVGGTQALMADHSNPLYQEQDQKEKRKGQHEESCKSGKN